MGGRFFRFTFSKGVLGVKIYLRNGYVLNCRALHSVSVDELVSCEHSPASFGKRHTEFLRAVLDAGSCMLVGQMNARVHSLGFESDLIPRTNRGSHLVPVCEIVKVG